LSETTASDDELVTLMLAEPRLVRRPIVIAADGTIVVGGDPAALQSALAPRSD
jgi:arsenate reductase-like glutaredoxin family protein